MVHSLTCLVIDLGVSSFYVRIVEPAVCTSSLGFFALLQNLNFHYKTQLNENLPFFSFFSSAKRHVQTLFVHADMMASFAELMYRVFRKDCVFSQFTATPLSPASL